MSEENNPYGKLNGELPPECVNLYKGFLSCKLKHDEELFKDKDEEYKKNYQNEPFSRVQGCKNMWNSFYQCKDDFMAKYIDLKNYVAELRGDPPAFRKDEIKKDRFLNYSKYNYGLYKF
jgi:hypothetical protein